MSKLFSCFEQFDMVLKPSLFYLQERNIRTFLLDHLLKLYSTSAEGL